MDANATNRTNRKKKKREPGRRFPVPHRPAACSPTPQIIGSPLQPLTRYCHLKRLTHRLKVGYIFSFQLSPYLFKTSDSFLRIEALSAMQTNLSMNFHDGGVNTTPQQFLNYFFHKFSTTNRTPVERFFRLFHYSLLFQFIHLTGSGRYTVTSTAHFVSLLYAHAL